MIIAGLNTSEGFLKRAVSILPDIPNGDNLSTTQRMLRKLKRDPKLFLFDVAKKQLNSISPKSKE